MDKPRRRAAGRPAGPPAAAPHAATRGSSGGPSRSDSPLPAPPDTAPSQLEEPDLSAPDLNAPEHRRRQRPSRPATDGQSGPKVSAEPVARPSKTPARSGPATPNPPVMQERRRNESAMERALRALVSTRTTQLPPTVAMRAREVAAPSAADLRAAEEELIIVRRHYKPPAPLVKKSAEQRVGGQSPEPDTGHGRRGGRRGHRPTS